MRASGRRSWPGRSDGIHRARWADSEPGRARRLAPGAQGHRQCRGGKGIADGTCSRIAVVHSSSVGRTAFSARVATAEDNRSCTPTRSGLAFGLAGRRYPGQGAGGRSRNAASRARGIPYRGAHHRDRRSRRRRGGAQRRSQTWLRTTGSSSHRPTQLNGAGTRLVRGRVSELRRWRRWVPAQPRHFTLMALLSI